MLPERKDRQRVEAVTPTTVKDFIPSVTLVLMVGLLITASFLPGKPEVTNGLICLTLAVLTMILEAIRGKNTKAAVIQIRQPIL